MKRLVIILALSFTCWYLAGFSHVEADIYSWTDEKGVRHYSNSPPPDAEDPEVIFEEYQHDPASDKERFEMEQQEWQKLIQQIEADDREAAEEAKRRAQDASNQDSSLEERAAAEQQRLEETIADLEGGADFATLAQERSEGPSGPAGGALGWFEPGRMVPEFGDAVQAMEAGAISAPIRTQFGWHVIRLNESRDIAPPSLEELRASLVEEIQRAAIEARVASLSETLEITRTSPADVDPALLDDLSLLDAE